MIVPIKIIEMRTEKVHLSWMSGGTVDGCEIRITVENGGKHPSGNLFLLKVAIEIVDLPIISIVIFQTLFFFVMWV